MDLKEAMAARHSVRQYKDIPLLPEAVAALEAEVEACNREGGLHIQLVRDEPRAFDGFLAHYGKFSGVKNYFALVGKKGPNLEEKCGYYGQRLVLKAQQMGLNTCWVALSYSKVKTAFVVDSGEKLCVVTALGYGKTQGVPHRSKGPEEVAPAVGTAPRWFQDGVETARLAPSAMNRQKFTLIPEGDKVTARAGGSLYAKLDLGIVKYQFELGAGRENFHWA